MAVKSNYPFLSRNQKTEEERQRENINNLWNQLGSMGITGKQSFFTGYGEDGKLQPDRPTGIMNTDAGPKTIHEGEVGNVHPNGEFDIIPASQVSGAEKVQSITPASQVGGQSKLMEIEENTGMGGYQTGHTATSARSGYGYGPVEDVSGDSHTATSARSGYGYGPVEDVSEDSHTATSARSGYGYGPGGDASGGGNTTTSDTANVSTDVSSAPDVYEPFQTRGLQRLERYAEGSGPIDTAIRNAERERFAGEAAATKGALSQELAQADITGREAATEQFMANRQIGSQENAMMQGLRKSEADRAFTATTQLPALATAARTEDRMRETLDFERERWSDTEGSRALTDALAMGEETWLRKHPDMTSDDYAAARNQATLDQERFDLEKEKYQDSEGWKAYEAAILAGDFNVAADMYRNVTGAAIDTSQMQKYQDYLITKREQDITTGDLAIDAQRLGVDTQRLQSFIDAVNNGADLAAANDASGLNLTLPQFNQIRRDYTYEGQVQIENINRLRTQYGNEVFDSIMNRISSGASRSMVNDEFGVNLSPDDFMNMQSSTEFGQTQWNKDLSAMNMLLQTQDPENIKRAEKMFAELFPGADIDFQQLVDDVGRDRFAQGMSDMATLASTFDTWEEAQGAIEGMGLRDTLGMSTGGIGDLFYSLKINQIDEEWSTIEDSGYYQTLLRDDPDAAQLIQDTFSAGLTGELEFDINPVYEILDENGRIVNSFDNIKDAEGFLTENPDANYSVNEGKNYIYKNISTGDTVVVNNGENGENETVESGYEDFLDTIPEGITPPDYYEWKNLGGSDIRTYDDYLSKNTFAEIDNIEIESYGDLLKPKASDALFRAWNKDEDAVKGSTYYYEIPDKDRLSEHVKFTYEKGAEGTDVSDALKNELDASKGKIMQFIPYDSSEPVTGQLVDKIIGPSGIQLTIRNSRGELDNYFLVSREGTASRTNK